jgi:D-alanine-D-alanine ligase
MRIGLTYDLRPEYLAAGFGEEETAEFDRPETVEAIERALGALGHQTDRIGHVRQLVARLAAGDRWDLVFNFAEGMYGIGREAQVPAFLDAYRIAYTFSDPLVMALSLHKGMTKQVVCAAGIPTPDFSVVHDVRDLEQVDLRFPVFAKPVAEGTGKGISAASKIGDRESLIVVGRGLLERYGQPVLVERFLPGRELTVGIWGTGAKAEVIGTMEIILNSKAEPEVYSYVNKERCEELVEYRHPSGAGDEEVRRAEAIALASWRALGCRDAGRVDLRSDETGQPQFLEVNPLAGLHPQHSDLPMICTARGIPYERLVERIVESTATRVLAACQAPFR